MTKKTLTLLTAILFAMAAFAPIASAGGPGLSGKSVLIKFNIQKNTSGTTTISMSGKVKISSDAGMMLAATKIGLYDGSRPKTESYKADVFIPWSAVLYVKVL